MPVPNLISLMKSVIKSSLKTQTKGREKLSLEGKILIMVDPKEFERSLGEEIPEEVLNRLKSGDEMVVHRFGDTRLERPQPSDRRDNRHIHSIYFPSDCRLFIYIPTETGSYWHQIDMQRRAERISQQGCMVNENGCKVQAKQIPSSEPNTDASSNESLSDSDEKQMIFHKSQMKSIKTLATKRPSDSTRIKLEKNIASDKKSTFPSSEGVKTESWEKVSYSKIVPATDVSSHLSSPKQNYKDYDMQNIYADLPQTQTKLKGKTYLLKNAAAYFKRAFDSHGTRRPSDSTGNNFEKLFVSNENLAFQISKGVEVNHVSQKRDKYDKIELSVQTSMILESYFVYTYPLTPAVSSYASIPNQNINNQERRITHRNENRDVAEYHQGNGEHLVSSQNLEMLTTQNQKQDEGREATILMLQQILSMLSDYRNRNNEERCITQGNEKENGDVAENHEGNGEHLVTSQNLDTPITQDQIQDERHKSTQASESSANHLIHHTDICSDDHRTTFDSQEDNSTGMPGCMINENGCKFQDKQTPSSEANTDASSDAFLSAVESTRIRLYRNVIRNETYRMMSSIDMVMSEAEQLFGLERSQIFFDLLAAELCQFGSAGAISEFVPNMVESTVRQNVISFFEHSWDTMNRLKTLLLRCPDSKILQKMPEQNFISLMKSVIKSSLKTKTKGREKLSLEGNIYTMVDPKEFERSLGEEIPEDVLNRLRRGDEMVVHRFVDTRLERPQPSDRRENRPILSFFLPSDCLPFIYIPTENGSYWHRLNMQRASRIH